MVLCGSLYIDNRATVAHADTMIKLHPTCFSLFNVNGTLVFRQLSAVVPGTYTRGMGIIAASERGERAATLIMTGFLWSMWPSRLGHD